MTPSRPIRLLLGWTGLPDFLAGSLLDGFAHLGLLYAALWLLPHSLLLALLSLLASILWSIAQASR